jgi:hypothetical protein
VHAEACPMLLEGFDAHRACTPERAHGDSHAALRDDGRMREFRPPNRPSVLRVVLAVFVAAATLGPVSALGAIAFGISRVSYSIAGGTLTVRSGDLLAGERKLPLAEIAESRVVTLPHGRRTSGTALPGYCVGHYTYPDLGAVWQATNCGHRGVLVRAKDDARPLVLVLTPPDPEGFLVQLRDGTETVIDLPQPEKGPLFVIAAIAIPLAIVMAVMVGSLMLFGPSRMRYLVGDGALEVRTMFGRKRWSTAGARAKGHTPARLWRVAGAGMPGYYTGLFREGGQSTRLYATDLTRIILFEGEDRVMVSPEDRAGFLEALRAEGVEVESERS